LVDARVSGLSESGVRLTRADGIVEDFVFGGTVIDATGRAAMITRRKGERIAIRDRSVAELIEESSVAADAGAPTWLDVWKHDDANWSYRVQGVDGKAQVWRIRRAGTRPTPGALLRVDASASILTATAGEGWMAVGDAASAFDPIASQGLFNALSSALVAAGALQSSDGLTAGTARAYADAVGAAFFFSEAGRANVYGRLAAFR
jgi:hypothetical protein